MKNKLKVTRESRIKIGKLICLGLLICAPINAFGLESVRFAIKELCQHIEGNLGGLLMVTAGVGGMISAAFGNMKSLYTFVITGIGAFTASSMLSLYFPEAYGICSGQGGGGGGGAGARTKQEQSAVSKIDEVSAVNNFFHAGDQPAFNEFGTNDEESDADLF